MNRLNFFGVGPKIGMILLPWLACTIILSRTSSQFFTFSSDNNNNILLISGTVLLVAGLVFYFSAVRYLLKGLKEIRLVTNGPFYLCQNPLYVAIILFLIPAIALLMNSWLILTSTVVGFILLKIFLNKEYNDLESYFGTDYLKYKSETPEFIPLPLKKWFKKN